MPTKHPVALIFAVFSTYLLLGIDGDRSVALGGDNPSTAGIDLNADLPAAGRSLFDSLAMLAGDPSTQSPRVPYPFPRLLDFLKANGANINHALIPTGRSLQRLEAAPNFFRFPRVVIAASPSENATPSTSAVSSNIYIGYVEPADQLEVISINPVLNRYEFQIVSNYSSPTEQRIFYANRSVCTSCHQNKATIFSGIPWQETQQDDAIVTLLGKYLGTEYLGLKTGFGENFAGPSRQSAQQVDFATDLGSTRLFVQDMWQRSCGSTGADAPVCRAFFLAAMISGTNRSAPGPDDALFKRFAPAWDAHFAANYPAGFRFPLSNIQTRIPFPSPYNLESLLSLDEDILGNIFQKHATNIPAHLDAASKLAHDIMSISSAQEEELVPANSTDILNGGFVLFLRMANSLFHPVDIKRLKDKSFIEGPSGNRHAAQFNITFLTSGAGLSGPVEGNFIGGRAPFTFGQAPFLIVPRTPATCEPQADAIAACTFPGPYTASGVGTNTVLRNFRVVVLDQTTDVVAYSKASFEAEGDYDSLCFKTGQNGLNINVTCQDTDPRALGQVMSRWADAATTQPEHPLNDPIVRPFELMSGVFSLLGIQERPMSCCAREAAGLPPPQLQPDSGLPRALLKDPDLQTIARSCYKCHHTPNGPRDFLRGATEAEITAKVRAASNRMLTRFTHLTSPMPPASSEEAGLLDASERQALQSAIQKFVPVTP